MKLAKRTFLRIFFGIELTIFVFMYLFGSQGMRVLWQLQRENKNLDHELKQLHSNVDVLMAKSVAWQSDPFLKEKIARERLHMSRKNDIIFYVE